MGQKNAGGSNHKSDNGREHYGVHYPKLSLSFIIEGAERGPNPATSDRLELESCALH
jgi:hypothetical protein